MAWGPTRWPSGLAPGTSSAVLGPARRSLGSLGPVGSLGSLGPVGRSAARSGPGLALALALGEALPLGGGGRDGQSV